MKSILGRLGGGGDVGGVFVLPRSAWQSPQAYIVSFNRCNPNHIRGRLIGGSLVQLLPRYNHGRRFFEDKIFDIGFPATKVYVICLKTKWDNVLRGKDKLVEVLQPQLSYYQFT